MAEPGNSLKIKTLSFSLAPDEYQSLKKKGRLKHEPALTTNQKQLTQNQFENV